MTETAAAPQRDNPLLQRVKMPGETFTLPSGGLFYKDGEVLDDQVKNAEVHVYPMTALDEIVMKTPDLLFSGKAVEQVFARCIPSVVDVHKMLAKDVDFLLTCLRKVSYGDVMKVDYTHTCENAKRHTYEANITSFIRNAKRIDPTTLGETFTVDFPNGQVAKLQPVLFGDFVRIMQTLSMVRDDDNSPERIRDEVVESASGLITEVDGIDDHKMIKEWLREVPPPYIDLVNDRIDETSTWGADFSVEIVCEDCGKRAKFDAPLNPLSFFT